MCTKLSIAKQKWGRSWLAFQNRGVVRSSKAEQS